MGNGQIAGNIENKIENLFKEGFGEKFFFIILIYLISLIITNILFQYSDIYSFISSKNQEDINQVIISVGFMSFTIVSALIGFLLSKNDISLFKKILAFSLLLILHILNRFALEQNIAVLPFFIFLSILYLLIFLNKNWECPNFLALFTILTMLISLFVGTNLIYQLYGPKPLETNLYEFYCSDWTNTNNIFGKITCGDSKDRLVKLAENIECRIEPKINAVNANISFKTVFMNKTKPLDFTDFHFTIPDYTVKEIIFTITGEFSGKEICLVASEDYSFYSYEETKERNEKFITYLIALVGAIFITIPSMMISFKNIFKNIAKIS